MLTNLLFKWFKFFCSWVYTQLHDLFKLPFAILIVLYLCLICCCNKIEPFKPHFSKLKLFPIKFQLKVLDLSFKFISFISFAPFTYHQPLNSLRCCCFTFFGLKFKCKSFFEHNSEGYLYSWNGFSTSL